MNNQILSLKGRKNITKEELDSIKEKLALEKKLTTFEIEEYYNKKTSSQRDIIPYFIETTPQEELLKRYEYLYRNKELILALCIKNDIDYEYIKEDTKKIKRTLKNDYIDKNIKEILEYSLKRNKDILSGNKIIYYLFSNVSTEITDAYEEFLFTTNNIADTTLYKHIEAIKNNPMYLASTEDIINKVEQRRKYCHNETFTVWKILTYVREKNINDKKTLQALDKYYNLDRYITTGLNLKSGYEFLEEDFDIIDNSISEDRIKKENILCSVSFDYKKLNKFEDEDDYYDSFIEYTDANNNSLYKTIFMRDLVETFNLKEEDKKALRDKLIEKSKKRIK